MPRIPQPGDIASATRTYLTAEQEVALARRIRAGLTNPPRSNRCEPVAGADAATIADAHRAHDELVRANLRIVYKAARDRGHLVSSSHGLTHEDLVAEGLLELTRCALAFDPERGFRFSTYAQSNVERAMVRLVKLQGSPVRLTHRVQGTVDRVMVARERSERAGSPASWEELAAVAGLAPAELTKLWNDLPHGWVALDGLSIDMNGAAGWDNTLTNGDALLPHAPEDPAAEVTADDANQQLWVALDALPGDVREVVAARYGFTGGRPLSIACVADKLAISKRQVVQLEARGLAALRSVPGLAGLLTGD